MFTPEQTTSPLERGFSLPTSVRHAWRTIAFADVPQEVESQFVALLYRAVPQYFACGILSVAFVGGMFFNAVAGQVLALWTVLILSAYSSLLLQWRRYRHAAPQAVPARRWGLTLSALLTLQAAVWGSAAFFLFVPDSLGYQALLALVLAVVALVYAVTTAAYLPACYSTVTALITTVAASFALRGDMLHLLLSMGSLVFLALILIAAWHYSLVLRRSLELSNENSRLVKELTLKNIEAERSNAAKTRFLAAASHDLRQPMHALGLFVGALHHRILHPEVREIVEKAQASVDALEFLLMSLLDVSKLDSGIVTPELKDFPLQMLFDRMELQYDAQARHKRLELKVVATSAIVRSDAALLDRIVRNFLANALRYTVSGRVLLGCRRRPDGVSIQVLDTGPGVAEEHLETIFEEFYQVGNSERDRRKGLGLGLSIVRRLARLLDHHVDVRSIAGRGSCFSVKVPAGNRVHTPECDAEAAETPFDFAGVFVVIVDDDPDILESMQLLLTDWGCHALTASCGAETLARLAQHERIPDLIICDYRLRGELGADVIPRIRAAVESDVPALIATGDIAPASLAAAAASGYPLVHKPVSPDKLRQLIAATLLAEQTFPKSAAQPDTVA
jgi:two-component system, sensor histidine kinase